MLSTALKTENSCSRDLLHEYQQRAVEFIKTTPKCGLWVDMGLGKTVTVLTALADLFDRFEIGRVLIIAPLRVAKHTWPDEIKKWPHVCHLSHAVACGDRKKRESALAGREDIHVINRETVPWLVEHLGDKWPYDVVVIDESSSFKSHASQRFKSLRKTMPHVDRMVQLTGTPASNGLLDIWAQIYLLDRGERLGRTFQMYRNRYFTCGYTGHSWQLRDAAAERRITERIEDICMTLSAADYLELPERIDTTVSIELYATARAQYRQLEREFLLLLERSTVEVFNAATLTTKLLQLANGAIYTDENYNWERVHDEKLDALAEIIESANGRPVLVAYGFKSDRERIKKRFRGAVDVTTYDAIRKWNNGRIQLMIAHPASAGHGLNLQTGGSTVVWFGLPWSLELYQQFNARLHRQGQTQPVTVHHIVAANTVDETVMAALSRKNVTQKQLLDRLKRDATNRDGGR